MKMERSVFLNKYASHLNEKQLRAIQTIQGPVLLLAVPGSGKTTVLINRLGYMLLCEGIQPDNILTLTYTVAATNDMRRRFTDIFGKELGNVLEFRTINGICAKIIQSYAQRIGKTAFELVTDEKVTGKMLTEILVRKLSEYPTENDVKGIKTLITYSKNMLLNNNEIEQLGEEQKVPLLEIYSEYNTYLRNNALMDYDDQMIYAYRLLKGSPELLGFYQNKYKYICVDEAQDTSKIQHMIIGLLAGENGNLFMVGDEDQSIYGFRAAYPEALLHFEKEHSKARILVMDQNYRSNAKIVSAANWLIQNNKLRYEKQMVSTRKADSEIDYIALNNRANQYSYLVKVASDCHSETAVLYRDNESALPIIDQLDRLKIPYKMKNVDMNFFMHRVVQDVTDIMRFALDPLSTELFMRIYYKCGTYLKKDQAEQLCKISAERNLSVLDAVDFVNSVSGPVKGKCRALQTHLMNMLKESPSKSIFRIETPLGYGDYMERNNMDGNKLFILKMLANNEGSIVSFLDRLEYLQNMLKKDLSSFDCKFILSTIHSSKGLEYDQVYLVDVCDGIFPNKVISQPSSATIQEQKNFEEERRLFYVGMTRAKNDLHIFKCSKNKSCFLEEIQMPQVKKGNEFKDFVLVIGERVVQKKYGPGVVNDVQYNAKGIAGKFSVSFDSGEQRTFEFPKAFKVGMGLENKKGNT